MGPGDVGGSEAVLYDAVGQIHVLTHLCKPRGRATQRVTLMSTVDFS